MVTDAVCVGVWFVLFQGCWDPGGFVDFFMRHKWWSHPQLSFGGSPSPTRSIVCGPQTGLIWCPGDFHSPTHLARSAQVRSSRGRKWPCDHQHGRFARGEGWQERRPRSKSGTMTFDWQESGGTPTATASPQMPMKSVFNVLRLHGCGSILTVLTINFKGDNIQQQKGKQWLHHIDCSIAVTFINSLPPWSTWRTVSPCFPRSRAPTASWSPAKILRIPSKLVDGTLVIACWLLIISLSCHCLVLLDYSPVLTNPG